LYLEGDRVGVRTSGGENGLHMKRGLRLGKRERSLLKTFWKKRKRSEPRREAAVTKGRARVPNVALL